MLGSEMRRNILVFAGILIAIFPPFCAAMVWKGVRGESVAYGFAALGLIPLGSALWMILTPGRTDA